MRENVRSGIAALQLAALELCGGLHGLAKQDGDELRESVEALHVALTEMMNAAKALREAVE